MMTDAQARVLRALRDSIDANEISPSVRELCAATGLRQPSSVWAHLHLLQAQGLVTMRDGIPRSVRPTAEGIKALANGKAEAVTG